MRSWQGWQQNARQCLLEHNGILQTPRAQTENSWMLLLHFVIEHRVVQQLSTLLLSELLLLSSVLDRLLEHPIWTNHNYLEDRNYEFITDSCKCTFVYYYFHFMGQQKKKINEEEQKEKVFSLTFLVVLENNRLITFPLLFFPLCKLHASSLLKMFFHAKYQSSDMSNKELVRIFVFRELRGIR